MTKNVLELLSQADLASDQARRIGESLATFPQNQKTVGVSVDWYGRGVFDLSAERVKALLEQELDDRVREAASSLADLREIR